MINKFFRYDIDIFSWVFSVLIIYLYMTYDNNYFDYRFFMLILLLVFMSGVNVYQKIKGR